MKGVNWLHNDKIRLNCLEMSQLGTLYKIQQYAVESSLLSTGHDKISSYCLERSQLDTQCINQVIWSSKESIGYTMIKLG